MGISTRLNSAMQAVDVFMDIEGRPVRAVIPREVFERCLHCESAPERWLACYEQHAPVLHEVIRRRYAAKPQDFVVVRMSDFSAANA